MKMHVQSLLRHYIVTEILVPHTIHYDATIVSSVQRQERIAL